MDSNRSRFAEMITGLKQARDEIRLKVHLAGMDARVAWEKLEPKVDELERQLSEAGTEAARDLEQAIEKVGQSLAKLRDQLMPPPPAGPTGPVL